MSKFSLPKTEPKISEENALKELFLLIERYKIDVDAMQGKVKEATEQTLDVVLDAIMKGELSIAMVDGEVKVTQHIQHQSKGSTVKELVYAEMRGKDHSAMSKDASEYTKMTELLGSMCETAGGQSAVEQLRASDRKTAEALALLFL
ncbi:MAG: hypothetical protein P8X74_03615 [Reinekea sp.]